MRKADETMFRKMRRIRQTMPEEQTTDILNNGSSGVLAVLGDDDYPYTIPLNYVYDDGIIYFHAAKSGHKNDAIANHNKVSFCVVDRQTIVPEKFTTDYSSAVVFGKARLVENEEEIYKAMRLLCIKYTPGLEVEGMEHTKKDARILNVFAIDIEHMCGKSSKIN